MQFIAPLGDVLAQTVAINQRVEEDLAAEPRPGSGD